MDHEEDRSLSLGTEVSASVPPPSPLTGCYLLVIIGEPHTSEHKEIILQRLVKGLLSWDSGEHQVDLEKELATLTAQAPEGEEARCGERLIQFASENLVTEILIHPQMNTLMQCMRNLLSSFTRHRHLVHAGYTFAGNGSWIMQDGTFSLADFTDAYQENEVQRVIRAYENSISINIHCSTSGGGEWAKLPEMPFVKHCRIQVNPTDILDSGSQAIKDFIAYLEPYVVPASLDQLLVASDVVGNIRFSHPTLYVFPGGQGDAALFGINGFNMLVDGGFSRKACWWDFARHLDRLDAVLFTRLNNCSVSGMAAVLRRKASATVYPQIGHFFCNLEERRSLSSPDGNKDLDPLLVSLHQEGSDMMADLRHLNLKPQFCYRGPDPINLYHKVGHGTLDMYVLNPSKDSKYVRDFLKKWHNSEQKLFEGANISGQFNFPIPNLISICALLIWRPANLDDTITRIMFPGSTPQHKIFEGLEKLKHLEFLQYPTCTGRQMAEAAASSSISMAALKTSKQVVTKSTKEKSITSEKKDDKVLETDLIKIKDETVSKNIIDNKLLNELVDGEEKKIESVLQGAITAKVETKLDNKIAQYDDTVFESVSKKKETRKKRDTIIEKKTKRIDKSEDLKESVIKSDLKKTETKFDTKKKMDTKVKGEVISSINRTKASQKNAQRNFDKKYVVAADKKISDDKKSPPSTPKKSLEAKIMKEPTSQPSARLKTKTRKLSPGSTPAKSTKEANNRRVAESKYKQTSPKRDVVNKVAEKKEMKVKREPISRRPRPIASPVKGLKVSKSPTKTVKSVKTDNKLKGLQRVNYEDILKEAKKSDEDTSKSLDDFKQDLDDKEEQEIVREIEAVFNRDSETEEKVEFIGRSDIEKITCLIDSTKTEVTADSEFEEEYLIIEKEEVDQFTEDSIADQETSHEKEGELLKLYKDTEESEKNVVDKDAQRKTEAEANINNIINDGLKQNESKEHSISVDEKQDISSEKKTSDSKSGLTKPKGSIENIIQESQRDEKISTTVESGATTTAPTLPEDERITLDEIKEDQMNEENVNENEKSKIIFLPCNTTDVQNLVLERIPKLETLPAPVREIVKTPDEVADLPLHEEVDYRTYDEKKTSLEDDAFKRKPDVGFVHEIKVPKDLPLPSKEAAVSYIGTSTIQSDVVHKTVERPSHAEIVTVTPGSAPDSPMYPEQPKESLLSKKELQTVKEYETDYNYGEYTEKLRETHITTLDSPIKDDLVVVEDHSCVPEKITSIPEDVEKEFEEASNLDNEKSPLKSPKEVEKIVADVAEVLKSAKSLEEIMAEKSPLQTKSPENILQADEVIELLTSKTQLKHTAKDEINKDTINKKSTILDLPQKDISPVRSLTSEDVSDLSDKTVLSEGKRTQINNEEVKVATQIEKQVTDISKVSDLNTTSTMEGMANETLHVEKKQEKRLSITLESAKTLERLEEKIASLKQNEEILHTPQNNTIISSDLNKAVIATDKIVCEIPSPELAVDIELPTPAVVSKKITEDETLEELTLKDEKTHNKQNDIIESKDFTAKLKIIEPIISDQKHETKCKALVLEVISPSLVSLEKAASSISPESKEKSDDLHLKDIDMPLHKMEFMIEKTTSIQEDEKHETVVPDEKRKSLVYPEKIVSPDPSDKTTSLIHSDAEELIEMEGTTTDIEKISSMTFEKEVMPILSEKVIKDTETKSETFVTDEKRTSLVPSGKSVSPASSVPSELLSSSIPSVSEKIKLMDELTNDSTEVSSVTVEKEIKNALSKKYLPQSELSVKESTSDKLLEQEKTHLDKRPSLVQSEKSVLSEKSLSPVSSEKEISQAVTAIDIKTPLQTKESLISDLKDGEIEHDELDHKEKCIVISEKSDSTVPSDKSISPIPSENKISEPSTSKDFEKPLEPMPDSTILVLKDKATKDVALVLEKIPSPVPSEKTVSPVPSEKTVSPVLSIKQDVLELVDKETTKRLVPSEKSSSPVPSEKEANTHSTIVSSVMPEKEVSPVLSEKDPMENDFSIKVSAPVEVIEHEKHSHDDKIPSPMLSEKITSPVSSEKSQSPVPSEIEISDVMTQKHLSTPLKVLEPMKEQPASVQKDDDLKDETLVLDEKRPALAVTDKIVSPVPSEKSSSPVSSDNEGLKRMEEHKIDTTKVSPMTTETEMDLAPDKLLENETIVHDDKRTSIVSSERSASPVPSEKSLSSVSSEKDNKICEGMTPKELKTTVHSKESVQEPSITIQEDAKLKQDTLELGNKETSLVKSEKVASPVPSEKSLTPIPSGKEISEALTLKDLEKSLETIESLREPTISVQEDNETKHEALVLEEKIPSPVPSEKLESSIPSEKSSSPVPSTAEEFKVEEEAITQSTIVSSVMSEKEVSPVLSKKDPMETDFSIKVSAPVEVVKHEKLVHDDKIPSPMSSEKITSPIPSEKSQSPVPTEIEIIDVITQKDLNTPLKALEPMKEQPVSVQKDYDLKDEALVLDEKRPSLAFTDKIISPVPSEKSSSPVSSDTEGLKQMEEHKIDATKVSPMTAETEISSEMDLAPDKLLENETIVHDDKRPSIVSSERSASPVPSEKSLSPVFSEKDKQISEAMTPQELKMTLDSKESVQEPSITSQEEAKIKQDTLELGDKGISLVKSEKVASPVPSEKSLTPIPSEKEMSQALTSKDLEKSLETIESLREPTILVQKDNETKHEALEVLEEKIPSPVPSEKSVLPIPTEKSSGPVPSKSEEFKVVEEAITSSTKVRSVMSEKEVSPVLSEKDPMETDFSIKLSAPVEVVEHEKLSHDDKIPSPMLSEKITSPVPSEKSQSPVPSEIEISDVMTQKHLSTPLKVLEPMKEQPASVQKDDDLKDEALVLDEKRPSLALTDKIVSPVPSEKSSSPVSSDIEGLKRMEEIKIDGTKVSPMTADTEISSEMDLAPDKLLENETIVHDDKRPSIVSSERLASPVPSEKSLSPVSSEKDNKLNEGMTPKELKTTVHSKESVQEPSITIQEDAKLKQDTLELGDKETSLVKSEKVASPVPSEKSLTPIPSGKEISEALTLKDLEKSLETIESLREPTISVQKDNETKHEALILEEKIPSPVPSEKSVSPIPSEKSSGPVPSKSEEFKVEEEAITSSTIVSSMMSEKEVSGVLSEKDHMETDFSIKVSAPVEVVEHEQHSHDDKIPSPMLSEKITSPVPSGKSQSPVPSDIEISDVMVQKDLNTTLKALEPMKEQPVSVHKDDDLKDEALVLDEKRLSLALTDKIISSVPSEKSSSPVSSDIEGLKRMEEIKIDGTKVSPMTADTEISSEMDLAPDKLLENETIVHDDKRPSIVSSERSASPVPSEKSLSPVSSEKDNKLSEGMTPKELKTTVHSKESVQEPSITIQEDAKLKQDTLELGDKETSLVKSEKVASPVPSEKSLTPISSGKEISEALTSKDLEKSLETIESLREPKISVQEDNETKHEALILDEKIPSPVPSEKSVSPIPSEKSSGPVPSKSEEFKVEEEAITSSTTVSSVMSKKEVSPVLSEKYPMETDFSIKVSAPVEVVEHEKLVHDDKIPSPMLFEKITSPIPSEKSQSPVPSDIEISDVMVQKDLNTTLKALEPMTEQPVSVHKDDDLKDEALVRDEKRLSLALTDKIISPVPSEKSSSPVSSDIEGLKRMEEIKIDGPKVSPMTADTEISSEMDLAPDKQLENETIVHDDKRPSIVSSERSARHVPSEKSLSPVSSDKDIKLSEGMTPKELKTTVHSKESVQEPSITIQEDAKVKQDTIELGDKETHLVKSEKVASPVPSEKSVTPIPSEKEISQALTSKDLEKSLETIESLREPTILVQKDNETKHEALEVLEEKIPSPVPSEKSVSPIPSEKSFGPVPSISEEFKVEEEAITSSTIVSSVMSEKEVSPVLSEKDPMETDKLLENETIVHDDKRPSIVSSERSASPVPSEKSLSPVSSEKDKLSEGMTPKELKTIVHSKESVQEPSITIQEDAKVKQDTLELDDKETSLGKSEKVASPVPSEKSLTPIPSGKEISEALTSKDLEKSLETIESLREPTILVHEDNETKHEALEVLEEKIPSPVPSEKSVSPIPSEKSSGLVPSKFEEFNVEEQDITSSTIVSSVMSEKEVSPVVSEKDPMETDFSIKVSAPVEVVEHEKLSHDDKIPSPMSSEKITSSITSEKSQSVPSEIEISDVITQKDLSTPLKVLEPMKEQPASVQKDDDLKDEALVLDEKRPSLALTDKIVSPVPSEKSSSQVFSYAEGLKRIEEHKIDATKVSPMTADTEISSEMDLATDKLLENETVVHDDKRPSIVSSERSASPVPSEKSLSPVSSEKDNKLSKGMTPKELKTTVHSKESEQEPSITYQEDAKLKQDTLELGDKETSLVKSEKVASPVPSEKSLTPIPSGKETSEALTSKDLEKSLETIESLREPTISVQENNETKHEALILEEKIPSPVPSEKSVSPIPSEKSSGLVPSKFEEFNVEEQHITSSTIVSSVMSEKEVSPVVSEKDPMETDFSIKVSAPVEVVEHEKLSHDDKIPSPMSSEKITSSITSEKSQSVPSEIEISDVITQKDLSTPLKVLEPMKEQPASVQKDDDLKDEALVLDEKRPSLALTDKIVSPVPSEKSSSQVFSYAEGLKRIEEHKIDATKVSPMTAETEISSEMDLAPDELHDDKRPSLVSSERSASPVPSEKSLSSVSSEKDNKISEAMTPKELKITLESKESVQEPSITIQEDAKVQQDTLELGDKETSLVKSEKVASPVPSEKSLTPIPSEKEISQALSSKDLEKSLETIESLREPTISVQENNETKHEALILEEKIPSPVPSEKSVSPIPSEKSSGLVPSKFEEFNVEEQHITSSTIVSSVMSEKEVSPVVSEKDPMETDFSIKVSAPVEVVEHEKLSHDDKIPSPMSSEKITSSITSEKSQSVPSEIEISDVITQKDLSTPLKVLEPMKEQPASVQKDDDLKDEALVLDEKRPSLALTDKIVSPVPSEKSSSQVFSYAEGLKRIEEHKIDATKVSPMTAETEISSEMDLAPDELHDDKRPSLVSSERSASPVPSEKSLSSVSSEKDNKISEAMTPKELKITLESKESVQEPSITIQEDAKVQQDTLELGDKETSLVKSEKVASPVPSEKSLTPIPSEKEISQALSSKDLEKSLETIESVREPTILVQKDNETKHEALVLEEKILSPVPSEKSVSPIPSEKSSSPVPSKAEEFNVVEESITRSTKVSSVMSEKEVNSVLSEKGPIETDFSVKVLAPVEVVKHEKLVYDDKIPSPMLSEKITSPIPSEKSQSPVPSDIEISDVMVQKDLNTTLKALEPMKEQPVSVHKDEVLVLDEKGPSLLNKEQEIFVSDDKRHSLVPSEKSLSPTLSDKEITLTSKDIDVQLPNINAVQDLTISDQEDDETKHQAVVHDEKRPSLIPSEKIITSVSSEKSSIPVSFETEECNLKEESTTDDTKASPVKQKIPELSENSLVETDLSMKESAPVNVALPQDDNSSDLVPSEILAAPVQLQNSQGAVQTEIKISDTATLEPVEKHDETKDEALIFDEKTSSLFSSEKTASQVPSEKISRTMESEREREREISVEKDYVKIADIKSKNVPENQKVEKHDGQSKRASLVPTEKSISPVSAERDDLKKIIEPTISATEVRLDTVVKESKPALFEIGLSETDLSLNESTSVKVQESLENDYKRPSLVPNEKSASHEYLPSTVPSEKYVLKEGQGISCDKVPEESHDIKKRSILDFEEQVSKITNIIDANKTVLVLTDYKIDTNGSSEDVSKEISVEEKYSFESTEKEINRQDKTSARFTSISSNLKENYSRKDKHDTCEIRTTTGLTEAGTPKEDMILSEASDSGIHSIPMDIDLGKASAHEKQLSTEENAAQLLDCIQRAFSNETVQQGIKTEEFDSLVVNKHRERSTTPPTVPVSPLPKTPTTFHDLKVIEGIQSEVLYDKTDGSEEIITKTVHVGDDVVTQKISTSTEKVPKTFKSSMKPDSETDLTTLLQTVGKIKTETDTITKIIKEGENLVTQTITTVTTKEIISREDGTPQNVKTTIETTTLSKGPDGATTTTKDTQTLMSECSSSLKSTSQMDLYAKDNKLGKEYLEYCEEKSESQSSQIYDEIPSKAIDSELQNATNVESLTKTGFVTTETDEEDDIEDTIIDTDVSKKIIKENNVDIVVTITTTTKKETLIVSDDKKNIRTTIETITTKEYPDGSKTVEKNVEVKTEQSSCNIEGNIDIILQDFLIQGEPDDNIVSKVEEITVNNDIIKRTTVTRVIKTKYADRKGKLRKLKTVTNVNTTDEYPDGSTYSKIESDIKVTDIELENIAEPQELLEYDMVEDRKVDKKVQEEVISINGKEAKQVTTTIITKEILTTSDKTRKVLKTTVETLTEVIFSDGTKKTSTDVKISIQDYEVETIENNFDGYTELNSPDEDTVSQTQNVEENGVIIKRTTIVTTIRQQYVNQSKHSKLTKTTIRTIIKDIYPDGSLITKTIDKISITEDNLQTTPIQEKEDITTIHANIEMREDSERNFADVDHITNRDVETVLKHLVIHDKPEESEFTVTEVINENDIIINRTIVTKIVKTNYCDSNNVLKKQKTITTITTTDQYPDGSSRTTVDTSTSISDIEAESLEQCTDLMEYPKIEDKTRSVDVQENVIERDGKVIKQIITITTTKETLSSLDDTKKKIKTTVETVTENKFPDGLTEVTKDTKVSIADYGIDIVDDGLEGYTPVGESEEKTSTKTESLVENDINIIRKTTVKTIRQNYECSNTSSNKIKTIVRTVIEDEHPDGSKITKKSEKILINDEFLKSPNSDRDRTGSYVEDSDIVEKISEDIDVKDEVIKQGAITIKRIITTKTKREKLASCDENINRIRTTVETTTVDEYPDESTETTKDVKITISESQKSSNIDMQAALQGLEFTGKTKHYVDKKSNIITENGEKITQTVTIYVTKEELKNSETNEMAVKTVTETVTENKKINGSLETTKDITTQITYLPTGTSFNDWSPEEKDGTENQPRVQNSTLKLDDLTIVNVDELRSPTKPKKLKSPVGEITQDTDTFTKVIKEGENEITQTITVITTKEVISPEKMKITVETTTVSKGNDGVTKTTKSTKTTISEYKEEFEETIDAGESDKSFSKNSSKTGDLRSSSAASDDLEHHGISSPPSDISSRESKGAANVWGTESTGLYYSDDDGPGSPSSTKSQVANSPRSNLSFDLDTKQPLHCSSSEEMTFEKVNTESAQNQDLMSASVYGHLQEDDSCTKASDSKIKTEIPVTQKPLPKLMEDFLTHEKLTAELSLHTMKTSDDTFLKEADDHFEKAIEEHKKVSGSEVISNITAKYELDKAPQSSYIQQSSSSEETITLKNLTSRKQIESTATSSNAQESISDIHVVDSTSSTSANENPIESWGKPLGLPSPIGPPTTDGKSTPKKQTSNYVLNKNKINQEKNKETKRTSESPSKKKSSAPVYLELTYVPHHGNSYYSAVEFFKRVRARYYVFSGTEPSKEIYNALLDAKKTWENKDLEVTIIPTYDTDVLGYWVTENEEALEKYKIDLSPSASRCTINLQDHETSCAAYRLEF